jgi:hypothetical protein
VRNHACDSSKLVKSPRLPWVVSSRQQQHVDTYNKCHAGRGLKVNGEISPGFEEELIDPAGACEMFVEERDRVCILVLLVLSIFVIGSTYVHTVTDAGPRHVDVSLSVPPLANVARPPSLVQLFEWHGSFFLMPSSFQPRFGVSTILELDLKVSLALVGRRI